MGMIADYGSHFPIWCAAIARSEGPILELGTGAYSTYPAHFMSNGKRRIISADNDASWIKKFRDLECAWHSFHLVEKGDGENDEVRWRHGWLKWLHREIQCIGKFGCALVDCAPGEIRKDLILALKGCAKFIVIHDTEDLTDRAGSGGNYQLEKCVPFFKYQTTWNVQRPHTTVVSDFEDFTL